METATLVIEGGLFPEQIANDGELEVRVLVPGHVSFNAKTPIKIPR